MWATHNPSRAGSSPARPMGFLRSCTRAVARLPRRKRRPATEESMTAPSRMEQCAEVGGGASNPLSTAIALGLELDAG